MLRNKSSVKNLLRKEKSNKTTKNRLIAMNPLTNKMMISTFPNLLIAERSLKKRLTSNAISPKKLRSFSLKPTPNLVSTYSIISMILCNLGCAKHVDLCKL